MSEGTTVEALQAQLAESSAALSVALTRAERAEATARQGEVHIRELEALRDTYRPQRELLQAITDRVLAGILVLDGCDLRAKWANPAVRRMLDEPYRTQVDILGLSVEEFLPGAADIGVIPMLRQVASTGQAQSDPESEYIGFARGTTYWRWSLVSLPSTTDACPDLLLVVNELTEQVVSRQQVEALAERLAAEQRFLSGIMENIPAEIAYLDENLIYRHCNQAAAAAMGQPVERILGRHLRELHPGNLEVCEAIESVLHTGQAFRSEELPVRWPDRPAEGTQYYTVSYLPDKDPSGHVQGVIFEAHRVTALVEARQRLQEANDQLEERVRERTAELQAYSHRLVEAVENERRNLALELHDQAGQSLSALKLSLGQLRREVDGHGQHAARIEEMDQLIDGVMDDLHRLALNLRPVSLDRYGLLPALEQYVEFYRQQSGLHVVLVAVGIDKQRLPADVETALYRVIQEALTNVLRHARARRVGVVLERRKERVVAIIEDDGQGSDVAEALRRGRLGLLGMRERAEMLGGSLTIESAPGRGMTVLVDLPCVPTEVAL